MTNKQAWRRLGRVSLWISGTLLLLLLALYARLLVGPIALDALNPRIAAELEAALPGYQVSLQRTRLLYEGRQVAVRAFDVRLSSQADSIDLALPELGIDLRARALLTGRLTVDRLVFIEPDLALDWSARSAPDPDLVSEETDLASLVEGLVRQTRSLGGIALRRGRISLLERSTGQRWRIQDVSADITPGDSSLSLQLTGRLAPEDGGAAVPVRFTWQIQPDGHHAVSGRLEGFRPAAFAAARWPGAGLDLPLTLDSDLVLARDLKPMDGTVRIRAEAGQVAPPGLYPDPRPVDSAEIRLTFTPENVRVAEAAIALGETTIRLSGQIDTPFTADREVAFSGGFDRLSVAELVRYWPPTLARGGRRWVAANIGEGMVYDGRLSVPAADGAFRLDFRFEDLVTDYLRPMPPATGLTGTGRLRPDRLDLMVEEGRVADLQIRPSTVVLKDLDKDPAIGVITVALSGGLKETLLLADHDPLGFISRYGLDTVMVRGLADTEVDLELPLISELALADVRVAVTGQVRRAALPVAEDFALEGARLSVTVDNRALTVSGTGQLAGLPADLRWDEAFEGPGPASRYQLKVQMDAADLGRFDVDLGDRLSGPLGLDVKLAGDGEAIASGTVRLDMTAASVNAPLLDWVKPAGLPAALSAGLSMQDGIRLDPVTLSGPSASGQGRVQFDAKGSLNTLSVEQFAAGGNALSARLSQDGATRRLDVRAERLTLAPVLKQVLALSPEAGEDLVAGQVPPASASRTPLSLRLTATEARLANGIAVEGLSLTADRSARGWVAGSLEAWIDDQRGLRALLSSAADGSRAVRVEADDAGTALRGLGLFANALGGRLVATSDLSAPHPGPVRAGGQLTVEDFRLVRTDTIGAVIEAGEAEGLEGLVGPDGLEVTELVLPFTLADGVIDIEEARANGPRLGVTLEGQIDQRLDRLNVNGIIVPAYRLNALINNIPLVGDLLVGGKGEGLFAVNYRVSGAFSDPDVDINRLTALAPGLIRGLFEHRKGTLKDLDPAPDEGQGG